jgi:flagellar hook-length control protein FliK
MLGKASEKDFKDSVSGSSFEKALQERIAGKNQDRTQESKKVNVAKDHKVQEKDRRDQDSESRKKDTSESEQKPKSDSKAESQVADKKGLKKRRLEDRQQAIKEFMDSFESEFKIPPTRLVEAMAKPDESNLGEATSDNIIENMNLDDSQAEQARAMYAAFLLQLQQGQTIQVAPGNGLTGDNSEVLGLSLEPSGKLQNELANLSDKPISMNSHEIQNYTDMKNSIRTEEQDRLAQLQLNELSEASLDEGFPANSEMKSEADLSESLRSGESLNPGDGTSAIEVDSSLVQKSFAGKEGRGSSLLKLPPHLKGQMSESVSPALLAALAEKKGVQANQIQVADLQQKADASSLANSNLKEDISLVGEDSRMDLNLKQQQEIVTNSGREKVQDFYQGQNQAESQANSQNQSFLKNSENSDQQGFGQKKELDKEKMAEKNSDFKSGINGLESQQSQGLKADALKSEGLKFAAVGNSSHVGAKDGAENQAAVKQLMNQAQYLIKKGGGEVKVEMSPGDMGTIHLKVLIQDGKVNLHMSTETPEAKQTIESSLAELKTSLAAHKLSVENIKIDVVASTSTDTATQSQTNSQGHDQRNQSRQFWNQFNDNFGNQGRRESFLEFQNSKAYAGAKKDQEPLRAIDTSSGAIRSLGGTMGKGKGLNLVA